MSASIPAQALAAISSDHINTDSFVQAGLTVALIDIDLTKVACEPISAVTLVIIDMVLTDCAVHAWLTLAFVNVDVASSSSESRHTFA